MPLDESVVGRTYPADQPYEVGREKIREFASAIGDDNPVYTDPEVAKQLGHPDVVAPPTFVFAISYGAVQRQVLTDEELGLDFDRVVHGDQKFVYTRPVRAGDRLVVTTSIESYRFMAGNDIVGIRGEVHDVSGEHVVTAHTKLVVRGRAADEADEADKDGDAA